MQKLLPPYEVKWQPLHMKRQVSNPQMEILETLSGPGWDNTTTLQPLVGYPQYEPYEITLVPFMDANTVALTITLQTQENAIMN